MAETRGNAAVTALAAATAVFLRWHMLRYLMPVVVALVWAGIFSFVPEPHRRRINAVLVGGAGAAYISGGSFGLGELVFTAVLSAVAYLGLRSWTFIGVGWLLHTAWDILHHRRGAPLIPSLPDSSFGCAICDPVIALWCFTGGRSPRELLQWLRSRRPRRRIVRGIPAGRRAACARSAF